MIVLELRTEEDTAYLRQLFPNGYDTGKFGWKLLLTLFPDAAASLYNPNDSDSRIVLYGENLDGWSPYKGIDLSYANIVGTSFYNAELSGMFALHAVFVDCDFSHARLDGARLFSVTFIRCNFTEASLYGIERHEVVGLPKGDGDSNESQ